MTPGLLKSLPFCWTWLGGFILLSVSFSALSQLVPYSCLVVGQACLLIELSWASAIHLHWVERVT